MNDTHRLELWVHAEHDDDEVSGLRERLERLREKGRVDDVSVFRWNHELDLTSDRLSRLDDSRARERVAAFKQWARENGQDLLGFEERHAGVGRMGPEIDVEHLPHAVLAEYDGQDLVSVAPCRGGPHSVTERLDQLDGE